MCTCMYTNYLLVTLLLQMLIDVCIVGRCVLSVDIRTCCRPIILESVAKHALDTCTRSGIVFCEIFHTGIHPNPPPLEFTHILPTHSHIGVDIKNVFFLNGEFPSATSEQFRYPAAIVDRYLFFTSFTVFMRRLYG